MLLLNEWTIVVLEAFDYLSSGFFWGGLCICFTVSVCKQQSESNTSRLLRLNISQALLNVIETLN